MIQINIKPNKNKTSIKINIHDMQKQSTRVLTFSEYVCFFQAYLSLSPQPQISICKSSAMEQAKDSTKEKQIKKLQTHWQPQKTKILMKY